MTQALGPTRPSPQCPPGPAPESHFRPKPRSPGLMPLQLSQGDRQGRKPSHTKGREQEGELGAKGGYSGWRPQS